MFLGRVTGFRWKVRTPPTILEKRSQ
jgi:hypothetical protein